MNYAEARKTLHERLPVKGKKGLTKVGHNTYLDQRDEGVIALVFWTTDILLFKPTGEIVVDTNGYRTVTTKARLNEFLPAPYRVFKKDHVWYWNNDSAFSDGDIVMTNPLL
tara:strand:+ start:2715 stop:3047 length:333 start_codon:yes stop_codon:yes gene_type:complete